MRLLIRVMISRHYFKARFSFLHELDRKRHFNCHKCLHDCRKIYKSPSSEQFQDIYRFFSTVSKHTHLYKQHNIRYLIIDSWAPTSRGSLCVITIKTFSYYFMTVDTQIFLKRTMHCFCDVRTWEHVCEMIPFFKQVPINPSTQVM